MSNKDKSEKKSTSNLGFVTFPRESSGNKQRKPIVPPKPKKIIPATRHTIWTLKGVSNYYDALPVQKSKAIQVEEQNLYDSALPVCKDKLEECVYESIEFHSSTERPCTSLEEPLYDEAVTPNASLKKLTFKHKDGESIEELSDEDESDYFTIQKHKNQLRASWIEHVESRAVHHDQPLERISSNPWNSQDDDDDDDDDDKTEDTNKNLMELRKSIINEIIKDEKYYAEKLKKISEKYHLISSLPPSVKKDLEVTMEVVSNLLYLHKTFSNDLQKVVTNGNQNVGHIIEKFVEEEFIQAQEYTTKYRSNIMNNSDSKFSEESFQSFLSSLSLPIWRFQNCIHYLKRLLKHTPITHLDYNHLQRALQLAKSFFSDLSTSSTQDASLRHLVKKGLVVIQLDNERKLRYLFLFNDVIVCAKQRIKNKLAIQWFVQLHQLSIDDKLSVQQDQDKSTKEKTSSLKKSIIKYQAEYCKEFKSSQAENCKEVKSDQAESSKEVKSVRFIEKNRKLDVLRKKLMELETELVLNAPNLRLVINTDRKQYTILLASDYERAAWKSSIASYASKAKPEGGKLTLSQVSILINDIKISPPFSHDDVFQSSRIDGQLKLTIHKLLGLQSPSKVFCNVEVDSFGHFFLVARTNKVVGIEPEWNEGFDLELEGANTLRIICYQSDQGTDIHLGSTALEMNEAWLKEKFNQGNVSISKNMFIKISIEYSSPEAVTPAKLSFKSGQYFGVPLEEIARIEQSHVPHIIRSCVGEIERRGMKDTGLYRVSGLSSEIQKLKAAFNKNSTSTTLSLKSVDTNVITGTIKLFLRELPDPLFPSKMYQKFIKCILQSSSKQDSLEEQMLQLPPTNLHAIVFLFRHLVRVSEQATFNKMTLGNLATIFAPNLMRNPSPSKNVHQDFLLSNDTTDVTHQCKVILKLLTMVAHGCTFSTGED